jgi:hypothetical protein
VSVYKNDIRLFLSLWFGAAATLFLQGHVVMSSWAVALGAQPEELYEHLEFLSLPMAWASPRFLIAPDTGVVAILGISILNAYVYALALFPCVRVVQWSVRRNRVTQLGISRTVDYFDTHEVDPPEDDERR